MTTRTAENLTATELSLFRFDAETPFVPWASVDDTVMGGVSRSVLATGDDGTACFTGHLSLENNGGFCSVRSPDRIGQFRGQRAIGLHVRGDGKTYTVCLHTKTLLAGTSYRCRFTPPAGCWERVVLPFDRFVLMRFGNRVGVSPVSPDSITGVSLMISDRQEGPFALDLAEVTLVPDER